MGYWGHKMYSVIWILTLEHSSSTGLMYLWGRPSRHWNYKWSPGLEGKCLPNSRFSVSPYRLMFARDLLFNTGRWIGIKRNVHVRKRGSILMLYWYFKIAFQKKIVSGWFYKMISTCSIRDWTQCPKRSCLLFWPHSVCMSRKTKYL